ncbi:hypothetical protein GP486_005076 [Trichoglossum hirsutum]|uniref:Rhodopsin domain-containing protein n=1 Tax=Trichoglossum hirsutum TaxID=265104 RepID=A0A9P8L9X7_9PEZI|nr:hypothetical protein GP486_005076 [Trichoglossum hirsutum]
MGGFDVAFQKQLAKETWSLYGVGMLIITLRICARIKRVGVRGLASDDYLMIVAGCFYTTLVSCLNAIAQGGGSNLFLPEEFATFTEDDIKERIKGSKVVIVSEQAMLNVIYTVKVCMLIMYTRLTMGLKQQFAVKCIAVYVACGWAASELAFFFACRPFNGYWAVPPPDPQCTTLAHYAICQATFNLSSDTMMLVIALPLFLKAQLPLKNKIALVIIFGMGSFVIVAAILTKVFNLSDVYDTRYMFWYVREASTAVYVSNLPLIWPLLREWFPFLRSSSPASGYTKRTHSVLPRDQPTAFHLKSSKGSRNPNHGDFDRLDTHRGDSQECITTTSDPWSKVIHAETTVEVEEISLADMEKSRNNRGYDWRSDGVNEYRATVTSADDPHKGDHAV